MFNALSFDVEEWFQVDCFSELIPPSHWEQQESRIVESTMKILRLLRHHESRATFFVLGVIAEQQPQLVKKIAKEGHEIATHGYSHQLVYNQSPKEFEKDLIRSIHILEDITGQHVIGYRAPFWSITSKTQWVWDILWRNGIRYDSSIYPIHLQHGMPEAPRFNHRMGNGIVEIPLSTLRIFNFNIPVGGGASFRILPYWITFWAIRKINLKGHPAIVYIHSWELDPLHPRLSVNLGTYILHYAFLRGIERKLTRLLTQFSFVPMQNLLNL